MAEPLLIARQVIREQFGILHRRLLAIVRDDAVCRRLMTVPGVGPVVSLTYRATVDVAARFRNSKAVGAALGLTPSKYQSGEINRTGAISRCGDEMMRMMLYEAAQPNVMTKGRESATDVVCSGAGFDPHQTRLEVGHVPLKSPTRQLLAHDHFPTRIHSDEVKATLAEIHSDRSNTVIVHSDVSHGALLFANQLLLQHCHSLGWSAAGPYHYL